MKIAWFTPFARSSAVGRFSRLVAEELARLHDVDVWHPRAADVHATSVRTVAFMPGMGIAPAMLSPYDVLVYNLGDHFALHGDIWLASQAAPGITILHDWVMHHFFAHYYLQVRNSRVEYLAAVARWYGEAGRAAAERSFPGGPPLWESNEVTAFPLFEEALRRAHAVVVHADFHRRMVSGRFSGPVLKLPLPYDLPGSGARHSREQLGVPPGRILIVTIGRVNPNKRIPAVLEALGARKELRDRVYYAIVGACDQPQRDELARLVREHRLEGMVGVAGFASEERLRSWLAHADVFVNLRCPAMEGGSASLAEEMLAGKPVVVADEGVYGEMPGDCVVKITAGCDPAEVGAALSRLVADPAARRDTGASARRFAERDFDPARYAAGFLDLAAEMVEAKPLLALADRMADRMAEMGIPPEAGIVSRVAEECYSLFCGRPRRPSGGA